MEHQFAPNENVMAISDILIKENQIAYEVLGK